MDKPAITKAEHDEYGSARVQAHRQAAAISRASWPIFSPDRSAPAPPEVRYYRPRGIMRYACFDGHGRTRCFYSIGFEGNEEGGAFKPLPQTSR